MVVFTPRPPNDVHSTFHRIPPTPRRSRGTPLTRQLSLLSSSPKIRFSKEPMRSDIPPYVNSSSSTGTRTMSSHMTSYCSSSSPSTRVQTYLRQNEFDRRQRDSSTTINSSSRQSDSLYNEPTRKNSARVLTTPMNDRWKRMNSPSYSRRGLSKTSIDNYRDDDDDDAPRQVLLPIGGGIVGKLASSTTNLSYRT